MDRLAGLTERHHRVPEEDRDEQHLQQVTRRGEGIGKGLGDDVQNEVERVLWLAAGLRVALDGPGVERRRIDVETLPGSIRCITTMAMTSASVDSRPRSRSAPCRRRARLSSCRRRR